MKRHVLIIDDDAPVRESMRKVLTEAGYEVVTAADGEEALFRCVGEAIDVVLLDVNLPFQSGWEVFDRVTRRHPLIPVIIITALADQYRSAAQAGAGALMEKPVEVTALLTTMDELLAEPEEERLRRLCGHHDTTRYIRRGTERASGMPILKAGETAQRQPHGMLPGNGG